LRARKIKRLDTLISISLSEGDNRIECSVTNTNGTESYRSPLLVKCTAPTTQPSNVYFIGIGINHFKETGHDLKYSCKDIRDLGKKLQEKYPNSLSVDTLFNELVSLQNVVMLRKKLLQTTVNDKVIVAYSGHGLLSKELDYYLSTYTVNFKKPEEGGLPYEALENLLDSIPARKKLMLIDACHSGEVDKEEGLEMSKQADSLGLSKGFAPEGNQESQKLGLKNSFELMQSLFVNVGKSTGAIILSAAAGNQFALETGQLKNGVFTYSLLETLAGETVIKLSTLKKRVAQRVEQLTNGLQKPTYRNENLSFDWSL
jgi:hypothetical protein